MSSLTQRRQSVKSEMRDEMRCLIAGIATSESNMRFYFTSRHGDCYTPSVYLEEAYGNNRDNFQNHKRDRKRRLVRLAKVSRQYTRLYSS